MKNVKGYSRTVTKADYDAERATDAVEAKARGRHQARHAEQFPEGRPWYLIHPDGCRHQTPYPSLGAAVQAANDLGFLDVDVAAMRIGPFGITERRDDTGAETFPAYSCWVHGSPESWDGIPRNHPARGTE